MKHEQELSKVKKDYEKRLDTLKGDLTTLEAYLVEHTTVSQRKEKMYRDIAALRVQYDQEKKSGMIAINEAEFEKIKDVKKLTEEMDFKVKETQANLMALNDE
jgi:hypothetical protein